MKKNKQKIGDFDRDFNEGKTAIDFSRGILTQGLSKVVKLPPMTIPGWLAAEIEHLSQMQANSKASVIRQLLVEAIEAKQRYSKKNLMSLAGSVQDDPKIASHHDDF